MTHAADDAADADELVINPPDHGCKFMPTPEEIRAACLQIQSEWSPAEERNRRAWSVSPSELDFGRVVTVAE